MKVTTAYNNFVRGKVDHDTQGRFDLAIYNTGADEFTNFISDFKGNSIYRCGFESIVDFQDCILQEFVFSNAQTYILVFYNTKIRFLSYDVNDVFGWVLDGSSNILEVTTPYSLAQCADLQFSQNGDALRIAHPSFLPRDLTRLSANSFSLTIPALKGSPFNLTFDTAKTITAITNATSAVITSVAHGYASGDMVLIESVVGMTQINNYTAQVSVIDANNFSVNVDSLDFTAYASGGTAKKVLTTDNPACVLFYKARCYFARTGLFPTDVFASEGGIYDNFTLPITITATAKSPFRLNLTDISQRIEWLFGGDNSLIVGAGDGIVTLNSGSPSEPISAETIQGNLASADPSNYTIPLKKDGFVFYVSRNGRNLNYFSYELLSETFKAKDANILSFGITGGLLKKIRWKKDRYDLVYAITEDGKLLSCVFNESESIIGWHEYKITGTIKDLVLITDNQGNPQIFGLFVRNSVYYIERLSEYVEFKTITNFYTGDKNADEQAWQRYNAELLKSCVYLDNATIYSDLKSTTITYSPSSGTITASASSFSSGDVGKHIVYKTETGYESGRFEITGYTSATVVSVSVLQEPTVNIYSSWYKSFSSVSGLSRFNGLSISVVADGGYNGEFTVSAGVLTLTKQVTHVVVGYKYKGLIKSFNLGFAFSGKNTQTTMKAINEMGVRCTHTLGGQAGSSLYTLQPVQKLTSYDINYLPPTPIDGIEFVTVVDTFDIDKCFYIAQDEPLPMTVNCAFVKGKYTGD